MSLGRLLQCPPNFLKRSKPETPESVAKHRFSENRLATSSLEGSQGAGVSQLVCQVQPGRRGELAHQHLPGAMPVRDMFLFGDPQSAGCLAGFSEHQAGEGTFNTHAHRQPVAQAHKHAGT